MERVPVTKENFIQILVDYAEWKYSDEIKNSINECTWDLEFESDEFVYKQLLFWFIFERINPVTGKTILDEFIEFISKDANNRVLISNLLGMREIVSDTFKIIDRKKDNMIVLKGLSNQKKYMVKILPEQIEQYTPGRFVMAKIFRWENYYRFAGITKIKVYNNNKNFQGIITPEMVEQIQDYFEKRFVKDAESIIISRRSTLSGMLNKFPYWWIDGISASLLLNKKGKKKEKVKRIVKVLVNSQPLNDLVNNTLPKDSHQALLLIKERGGVVKYKEIVKKYTDDTNLSWEKKPPNTPIGLLRRYGLVIVGRMLINNRFYKVILIPKEILEKLSL